MPIQVGPGDPGAGKANLDGPPPPPPSLRTPDYSSLASNPQATPQGVPPGTQFLAMVAKQAQLVEDGVAALAQMLPTFVPVAAQVSSAVKGAVIQAMQMQAGQGGAPQGGPPQGGPPMGAPPQ